MVAGTCEIQGIARVTQHQLEGHRTARGRIARDSATADPGTTVTFEVDAQTRCVIELHLAHIQMAKSGSVYAPSLESVPLQQTVKCLPRRGGTADKQRNGPGPNPKPQGAPCAASRRPEWSPLGLVRHRQGLDYLRAVIFTGKMVAKNGSRSR